MGGDEDVFALFDVAEDGSFEEGEGAFAAVFEGFTVGGGDIVGASPDVDLLFAVFGTHVVFVEAGEVAVVAFVEGGVADDGAVEGHFGHEFIEGVLGAAEGAGVGDVDGCSAEEDAGSFGFHDSLGGEGDVDEASEAVFEVPEGLAVTDEDELRHGVEVTGS